jgi:hypothetical protein
MSDPDVQAAAGPRTRPFTEIVLSLPRHRSVPELGDLLRAYSRNGVTGIWLENDYLGWSWHNDGDSGFGNNWRLFNIFDFTRGSRAPDYQAYLHAMIAAAAREGLRVYIAFWLPKLNRELKAWLEAEHPAALGEAVYGPDNERQTWCSCAGGAGVGILRRLLDEFLGLFPGLGGLKISIKDNSAFICTHHCPQANGDDEASNAARVYRTVQQSLISAGRPPSDLIIYPWFWDHVEGMEEAIVAGLEPGYRVLTKYASMARCDIEPASPGVGRYFDASLGPDAPGPVFHRWKARVGGNRIVDMLPMANSMDQMFVAWPPVLALIWERWQMLAREGVESILDFECGGSIAPSTLAGLKLFQENPFLRADVAVAEIVRRMAGLPPEPAARLTQAYFDFAAGWREIPLTLAEPRFSGRFGQAWPATIATPLVADAFDVSDQAHRIHWFSPYNAFRSDTADRLRPHFARIAAHWQRAVDGFHESSVPNGALGREQLSAQACLLCAESALNWCDAAQATRDPAAFTVCRERQVALIDRMQALLKRAPELWANNCWHPHQMPLSQRNLGFTDADRDAFTAARALMERA